MEWDVRLREGIVVELFSRYFDLVSVDFLLLEELLLIDAVLLGCQFLGAGHGE